MVRNLIPIGSIVLLKGGEKKLMVCGRIQANFADGKIYDYIGCLYPEGILDIDEMYFFNKENIDEVCFNGYYDDEEVQFNRDFLDSLGELEFVDGEIVEVEPTDELDYVGDDTLGTVHG